MVHSRNMTMGCQYFGIGSWFQVFGSEKECRFLCRSYGSGAWEVKARECSALGLDQQKGWHLTKTTATVCQTSSHNAPVESLGCFTENYAFCDCNRDWGQSYLSYLSLYFLVIHRLTKAFWHLQQAIYMVIIIFGLHSQLTKTKIMVSHVYDQNCHTWQTLYTLLKKA